MLPRLPRLCGTLTKLCDMLAKIFQKLAALLGPRPFRARKITEDYWVSAQLRPADLAEVKEQGFQSVVCNRPDREVAPDKAFAEIEKAAKAEGLTVVYIPIGLGTNLPEAVGQLSRHLKKAPKPVLAYCRSGNRSTQLWRMAQK